ncbi:MAG: DNA-binding protein [Candidatus Omnitrophica bacterium]|jgi:hypothetical protein|nr:DNA-binding protein [Candidatus Omnitrophota bacterium]MDD3987469.1 DNA-binding protein [Candidatus Omnitrophota bacterium]MDD4981408.1 DNA-binding protein [Candidatus Omnitrophota bacterium]MDD5664848.1 DNA-binding protein [Candidatus Omnitrophota bacterium]
MKVFSIKWLLLFIFFTGPLCFSSAAEHVSSVELINRASEYEARTVTYKGEVIAEVMRRGDFAWVNLHDGDNAIGIWVPLALIDEITYTGSYKAKGDIIEVSGIFHRACPEHGGDLDIHALSLRKIESGKLTPEVINPLRLKQALVLLGILLLIWISTLFFRR